MINQKKIKNDIPEIYTIDTIQETKINDNQIKQTRLFNKQNIKQSEYVLRKKLQDFENLAKTQINILKLENTLSKQASDNFTTIQINALKNKKSKLSKYCCEIKETIKSDDLITDNNNLRDKLFVNYPCHLGNNFERIFSKK